jgi:hypothetical protein
MVVAMETTGNDGTYICGRLRAELEDARSEFDTAAARRRQLLLLSAQEGVTSDGVVTLSEAVQLHGLALKRYSSAFRRLSDFVVQRKLSEID